MSIKYNHSLSDALLNDFHTLAIEKNLIKATEIKKTASKKEENISDDFTQNLLSLCNQLKSEGLISQANDIEQNFITFKKCQAAMEYSKILQEAHPKEKLKNLEQNIIVNDILDNQLQNIKNVNSPVTGKYAAKKLLSEIGDILKISQTLDVTPKTTNLDDIEFKLNSTDPGWVSEDGLRCNGRFISEKLSIQAIGLNDALKQLIGLKTLASDTRFGADVPQAVNTTLSVVSNLLKDYLSACTASFKKARELEKQRLQNVNDINQSRVTFAEVGQLFKTGVLAKTAVARANNFIAVDSSIAALKADLGNLIFSRLSPGFDFDEEYMQGLKNKAFAYLNEIKKSLGSNG